MLSAPGMLGIIVTPNILTANAAQWHNFALSAARTSGALAFAALGACAAPAAFAAPAANTFERSFERLFVAP